MSVTEGRHGVRTVPGGRPERFPVQKQNVSRPRAPGVPPEAVPRGPEPGRKPVRRRRCPGDSCCQRGGKWDPPRAGPRGTAWALTGECPATCSPSPVTEEYPGAGRGGGGSWVALSHLPDKEPPASGSPCSPAQGRAPGCLVLSEDLASASGPGHLRPGRWLRPSLPPHLECP